MSKVRRSFLISGSAGGLGRFLLEELGGEGLTRESAPRRIEELRRTGADVIVHCAANQGRDRTVGGPSAAYEDNVRLTERLAAVPHRLFVYLSTVDVYSWYGGPHREDDPIPPGSVRGLYAATKLIGESLVRGACREHMILRPVMLLGKYMRKGATLKILEGDCSLGLSGNSTHRYVLYEDVLEFLRTALDRGLRGIFNVASSDAVALSEVARLWGRRVEFGNHRYAVPDVDNAKIAAVCPRFRRGSLEVLRDFAGMLGKIPAAPEPPAP